MTTATDRGHQAPQIQAQAPLELDPINIPLAPPYSLAATTRIYMDQLPRYDSSWETPIPQDTSLDTLKAYHTKHHNVWNISKASRQTHKLTKDIMRMQAEMATPTLKVSSCLCLGLGSLFYHTDDRSPRMNKEGINERVMGQLVAFESWVKILREHFDIPNVYFQDPTFNSLDRAFLTSLGEGFQVIDSPASSSVIDEETFLFAPNASKDALYVSLKACSPALYVGNKLYHFRISDSKEVNQFLKFHPWIRDLEGRFLKCKDSERLFRMSAWDEDKDDKVWGSLHWPLSENYLEKDMRRPPRKLDRRLVQELLETMKHVTLKSVVKQLEDAEEGEEDNSHDDLDIDYDII